MFIAPLKRYIVTGTALLALGYATPASGQTPEEKAGARAAANQGLAAFEAGDYERAIDRFKRANELIRAPTHTLFLARANDKLGNLVLARELYIEIDREQLADDAPPPFVRAQQDARKELEAIDARVPRITVDVTGPGADQAEVTMDGHPVPSALVGLKRPVDPGKHRFRAVSGDAKARPMTVTIKEGEEKGITLELKELADTVLPPDPDPVDEPEEKEEDGVSGLTVAGYAALGVGVIGLGTGVYFNVQKGDRESEADALFSTCNPRVCTDDERLRIDHMDDDASKAGNNSTVGFIVGGVGIVSGITMLLLAPSDDETTLVLDPSKDDAVSVRPWVGLGSAGLAGEF